MDRIEQLDRQASELCRPYFEKIEAVADLNRAKVLNAFRKNRVSLSMFGGSNGYGYGDVGRDTLDRVFADITGSEDALCRTHFLSGTHALTVALFGVLRPGDLLVSACGGPYDTLQPVIGGDCGSLADFGVKYACVPLVEGECDCATLSIAVKSARAVLVQRSRGYAARPALTIEEIERICAVIKSSNPNAIIIADNCYGEFTDSREPTEVGADLIAGSLIKNPGGAVAASGGYIAGKAELVELCAHRLTAPGTGRELGSVPFGLRELFLGLYFAPTVTEQALKTAVYASCLLELAGFTSSPTYTEKRGDIVTEIRLGTPERLIDFCRTVQQYSPVDSFVTPEPWAMPGYGCDVIMASGAFTNGSSIELSCDAPLREPYSVYLQGGVHLSYSKVALLEAVRRLI